MGMSSMMAPLRRRLAVPRRQAVVSHVTARLSDGSASPSPCCAQHKSVGSQDGPGLGAAKYSNSYRWETEAQRDFPKLTGKFSVGLEIELRSGGKITRPLQLLK